MLGGWSWGGGVATLVLLLSPLLTARSTFDVDRITEPEQEQCNPHCYHGICRNGSCVCAQGWTGVQCDQCHGRVILDESEGVFHDGPRAYNTLARCMWLIEPNATLGRFGPLNFRVENFVTECGWDYLYIYDGDGVYGRQLAALSGDVPADFEIAAPSGKAVVFFSSDQAVTHEGFKISYATDQCTRNCSGNGLCVRGSCQCFAGYSGSYCEQRICSEAEEGQRGPCNDGICRDGRCECNGPLFHGAYCTTASFLPEWAPLWALNTPPAARASAASVLVDDALWVVGGETFTGVEAVNVVVFNVTSRRWNNISIASDSPRPRIRYDHTLVKYKNRLYMFGGVVDRRLITGELWSFDMLSRRWQLESQSQPLLSNTSSAPLAVAGHTTHVLSNEMYVFFGYNEKFGFVYRVQIYNFEEGTWRFDRSADHVHGRFGHSSVSYNNGKTDVVLIYGGFTTVPAPSTMNPQAIAYSITDSLMLFEQASSKWTQLPSSGVPLFRHSASLINGFMVVVGGSGHNDSVSLPSSQQQPKVDESDCFSREILSFDTGTLRHYEKHAAACRKWLTHMPNTASVDELRRFGHTAASNDEHIYVFGGFNGVMLNDVVMFTPADCSTQSRPEDCRQVSGGVRCVFKNGVCQPGNAFRASAQSFVKIESLKGEVECADEETRHELCEEKSNCVECASQPSCGWCSSGSQCLSSDQDCVDGQTITTEWSKCPSGSALPAPRPCSMHYTCASCKDVGHCAWAIIEGRPTCISAAEEAMLIEEENTRNLDRSQAMLSAQLLKPTMQRNVTCMAPCATLSDCDSCTTDLLNCMWCPTVQRCINKEAYMISFPYGQCQSWVTGVKETCDIAGSECSHHKTCDECQQTGPRCGWCDNGSGTGLGKCLPGSHYGTVGNATCARENWFFADCPACQCNGHSKCLNTTTTALALPTPVLATTMFPLSFLSPQRQHCEKCQNNTTGSHCQKCMRGFFGDPRNGGTCQRCNCTDPAADCDSRTGHCHCTVKGAIGDYCEKCDSKYYGDPLRGIPCTYELTVDFIFTFKIRAGPGENRDSYVTQINLFSIPYKKDTDVTFNILCEGASTALIQLNMTSYYLPGHGNSKTMMRNTLCDSKGIRRVYLSSEPGYAFGTESNTTFSVTVSNFTAPITIQVSFAQSPPINWVLFFVIFAACFIVLLVVAGLLWMIKLRIEVYRRNQRRIDEIVTMASRPFSTVRLELTNAYNNMATPIAVEPCANYYAAVYTLAVRLPTGGKSRTPVGASGMAVASALCLLTQSQLAVLQAPENVDPQGKNKTNLRRFIPFIRSQHGNN